MLQFLTVCDGAMLRSHIYIVHMGNIQTRHLQTQVTKGEYSTFQALYAE